MQDADTTAAENSDAFNSAFASEPPTSGGNEGEGGEGQPRDDNGRFAPKAGDEPTDSGQEAPAPKAEPEPEKDHRIPIRELLDERDRRQAAEREREALRQRIAAYERQQQAPQQRPDPSYDPEAYAEYVEQTVGGRVKSVEEMVRDRFVNMTFAAEHEQHGEKFEKAMSALEQARDPRVVSEIQNAVNPGKALMKWHSRHVAHSEVGDDIDGFKQKHRSQLMSDPEFRKEFMAALEIEARGGSTGSSSNITSLPSVNRAPGSAGNQRPGSLGDGNEERFSNAFAPRRRA